MEKWYKAMETQQEKQLLVNWMHAKVHFNWETGLNVCGKDYSITLKLETKRPRGRFCTSGSWVSSVKCFLPVSTRIPKIQLNGYVREIWDSCWFFTCRQSLVTQRYFKQLPLNTKVNIHSSYNINISYGFIFNNHIIKQFIWVMMWFGFECPFSQASVLVPGLWNF